MYNRTMKLKAREQIKTLLVARKMTISELADLLTKNIGKKYTAASLSAKMIRGSLSYNEMLIICDILDYKINFISQI